MKQVDASNYKFESYIHKGRFASFWCQTHEVLKLHPQSVLEIGPGPGIVTNLLRKEGIAVTTLDHAEDLGPDIVGSVESLPFAVNTFDVAVCCQVLEHLPFERFPNAISEISRVARSGLVLSLPRFGRFWSYRIYIPKIGDVSFGLDLQLGRPLHEFDGEHYWELDKKGYPVKRISKVLQQYFDVVRSYRLHDYPCHQFFICSKREC